MGNYNVIYLNQKTANARYIIDYKDCQFSAYFRLACTWIDFKYLIVHFVLLITTPLDFQVLSSHCVPAFFPRQLKLPMVRQSKIECIRAHYDLKAVVCNSQVRRVKWKNSKSFKLCQNVGLYEVLMLWKFYFDRINI